MLSQPTRYPAYHRVRLLVLATLLVFLISPLVPASAMQVAGTWSATGSMSMARDEHTATLLANGKVLVAGGCNPSGHLASAEVYDPATGTWSPTGSMSTVRDEFTATLLLNGKVLVAGGDTAGGYLASAEIYDPGLRFLPPW